MRRVRKIKQRLSGYRYRNHGILYDAAIYCPQFEERIEISSDWDRIDCGVVKSEASQT